MTTEPSPDEHEGIPRTEFIDNVDEYLTKRKGDKVEDVLKELRELHQKYQFYNLNLLKKREKTEQGIPEIETNLSLIEDFKRKKEKNMSTANCNFLVSDGVFTDAELEINDKVGLWLGANVMLEYSYKEAVEFLEGNLTTARNHMTSIESDLSFLRDQINTLEVNIARLHNWNVQHRASAGAGGGDGGGGAITSN